MSKDCSDSVKDGTEKVVLNTNNKMQYKYIRIATLIGLSTCECFNMFIISFVVDIKHILETFRNKNSQFKQYFFHIDGLMQFVLILGYTLF